MDVHPVLPEDTAPELVQSYKALLVALLLNSALCSLKLSPKPYPVGAAKYASRALNVKDYTLSDTDKGKALYRRALAHIAMKNDEEAMDDLQAALEVVPDDNAVKAEIAKLKAKQKEKKEKEKKAYKNLFS